MTGRDRVVLENSKCGGQSKNTFKMLGKENKSGSLNCGSEFYHSVYFNTVVKILK